MLSNLIVIVLVTVMMPIMLTTGVKLQLPGFIIIIVISTIFLLLMVISGLHLTRLQNQELQAKNRRFATR